MEPLALRANGPRNARATTCPHLGRKTSRNGTHRSPKSAKAQWGNKSSCWETSHFRWGTSYCCWETSLFRWGREPVSWDETQSGWDDELFAGLAPPSDFESVPIDPARYFFASVRCPSAGGKTPNASIHSPTASVCLPSEGQRVPAVETVGFQTLRCQC